jgi:hypothetical protein
MNKVCFSITGDFITEHSRSRVLEGEWEDAIRFLRASIIGLGIEDAVSVLSGICRFTGDSKTGLNLQKHTDAKYMEKIDQMYGHYIKLEKKWYVPYAYITSYGQPDFVEIDDILDNSIPCEGKEIKKSRARYYCKSRNDKIFVLKCGTDHDLHTVLFEKASSPPIWMDIEKTPQQAVDAATWHIEEDGFLIRNPYVTKQEIDQDDRIVVENPQKVENHEQKYEKPQIDSALISKFGWISPTGDFYGCLYAGHIELADDIVHTVLMQLDFVNNNQSMNNNAELALEKSGWIKIGGLGNSSFFLHDDSSEPTQSQHDTVFDWCQKHKVDFPDYIFNKDCI